MPGVTAFSDLEARVGAYYAERLAEHGVTARGVDWNGEASQHVRFEQLMRVAEPGAPVSVNDWGCGYGALVDWLDARRISDSMAALAHADEALIWAANRAFDERVEDRDRRRQHEVRRLEDEDHGLPQDDKPGGNAERPERDHRCSSLPCP